MARFAHPAFYLILVAGIVLASGFGSYLRAAHALLGAERHTIVICGDDGARTVTLDLRGEPVEQGKAPDCAHCADCSLVPVAALLAFTFEEQRPAAAATDFTPFSRMHPRGERVWLPSRSPPNQSEA